MKNCRFIRKKRTHVIKLKKSIRRNAMSNKRYLYLVIGMISMLFAGVIYAWSILKVSFSEFNWTAPQLSLNYTLTMCCFCLGGLLGSVINKKIGSKVTSILAALLTSLGFILTGTLFISPVIIT